MRSSLEIAQGATLRPIADVAAEAGIEPDELEQYGRHKAKVDLSILDRLAGRPDGKIVNVTAITPTPAGEGKTTTSVALTQGLGAIGRRVVLALREASLGPVFGVKGGAAGGGYAQVVPMEDLNLHFTGDLHAITAANNLLAALIDAHLLHGNGLGLDPLSITWRRCMRHERPRAPRRRHRPRRADQRPPAADRLRHHRGERGDGRPRGVPRPRRPPRAPGAHHRRPHPRGRARHGRGDPRRRRDDRPAEGGAEAQPRPDARGPAGARALRALREHRAREQLARRRPRRPEARRLPRDGVGLRLRHGHGEVLRHHVPDRGAAAERRGARRDGARAQAPRGRRRRRHGRARGGRGQPRAPHRDRAALRAERRRRGEPVRVRHPGRARARRGASRSSTAPTPRRSTPASRRAAAAPSRSPRRSSRRRTRRPTSASHTPTTRRSRRSSARS